ncbi:MAG: hypothetical protein ABSG81_02760 [Acidimicrobiales bacterium]|jgi:hypothetical protein
MPTRHDEQGEDLAGVRHRLDVMDDMRRLGGFRPQEAAAYGELCRREAELLGVRGGIRIIDPPGASTGSGSSGQRGLRDSGT